MSKKLRIRLIVFFVISTMFSFMTFMGDIFNHFCSPVYETLELFYEKMLESSDTEVLISFPQIKEMPKVFNLHIHEIWVLTVLPCIILFSIVTFIEKKVDSEK